MSDLAAACAELETWLPHAAVLTAQPHTDGTRTRSKPGTKPPGNWAMVALVTDIAEGVRRAEDQLRQEARLPVRHRGGSNRNTGLAIAAIRRYASTASPGTASELARTIGGWVLVIRQDPANDDAPILQTVAGECPYCHYQMVRIDPRAGRITCLRFGVCVDSEGKHPVGWLERNGINGDAFVLWNDGLTQYPS